MVFKKFEKNQIMGQIIIDFLPKLFHENHKFFKVYEITRMGGSLSLIFIKGLKSALF
jgi:hypothetical protein